MQISNKCLSPVSVKDNGLKLFRCGKCPNCLRQRANELSVRSYREFIGQKIAFLTFTYNDDNCPVLHQHIEYRRDTGEIYRDSVSVNECPMFFENAPYVEKVNKKGQRVKRYLPWIVENDDILDYGTLDIYYQSVRIRDVQLLFKRFRQKYPDVLRKYILVPEYGGCGYRPHYHLMVMGLEQSQIDYMVADWQSRFGFVDVRFPDSSNSRDVAKITAYISKYCSKGSFDCPYIKQGYCLAPRRSTPIGYGCGSKSDFEALRKMIFADDIIDWSKQKVEDLSVEQLELLKSRRVYNINGFHYPFPKYFVKKLLYEKFKVYSEIKGKVVYRYRASELQKAVSSYILAELVADATRKQEEEQRLFQDNCLDVRYWRSKARDEQVSQIVAESQYIQELETSSIY